MFGALIILLAAVHGNGRGCSMPLEPTRTAFTTTVRLGSAGPFRFLVDTGATTTVIDRSVAAAIGLAPARTIAAVSTTGSLDVQEAIVDEMQAGGVTIVRTAVLIASLPRFVSHGYVDGILGMSFFEGRSVLIDVRHGCLDVDAPEPHGTVIDAHAVVGRVAIEAGALNLILDSGASFPVLMSPRARALAVTEGTVEMTSAAGSRRVPSATIPVLRIGAVTLRDVAVALAPQRDPREDGLLPVTAFDSVYIAADRKRVVLR